MFILDKPKSESPSYLFCKMVINGVKVKKSLGFKVDKKDWENETTGNAANDRILMRIRDFVGQVKTDAKYTSRHLTPTMLSDFIDEILGKSVKRSVRTFVEVAREIIQDMKDGLILTPQGKVYDDGTMKQYNVVFNNLIDFGIKNFDAITINDYYAFISYCSQKKRMSTNTIGAHVRKWKRLMSIAEQKGYHNNTVHHAKKFRVIAEETKKVSLEEEEIESIANVEIDPALRIIVDARDWFVIDCYTGLRVSDLVELGDANIVGDTLVLPNEKTDEIVSIPIHPVVKEILDRRGGFPPRVSHQRINDHIKDVAQAAQINELVLTTITKAGKRVDRWVPKYKLITNHTARRSLITNARKEALGDNILMKITGIRSIKTLQRYDKLSPEQAAAIAAEHPFFKKPS